MIRKYQTQSLSYGLMLRIADALSLILFWPFKLPRLYRAIRRYIRLIRPFPFTETDRMRHTYLTGGSGAGKSEAMKVIIHHYIARDPSTALVVIDPHGEFAEQVAKMRENADSDRLIYVDPALDRRQSPTLNPFDLDTRDPFAIDVATQELVAVFAELLKGGAGFTLQMETLLKNCFATLLTKGGCGLSDLKDFMDDTANADLLAFADQNLSNPEQRDFLARDFRRDGYAQTKQSIRTRIQSLLNSEIFLNFLVGRSTFSLERGLRQRKLIVFNLASGKLGEDTTEAIGRFIIARLQTFAMRQGKLLPEWRVPVHLFVDECQYFLSPSTLKILTRTRTRKFKLYATLAQQFIGQETRSRDLIIALRGNTEIKITGRNTTHTLDILQKETATDLGELQRLQCGQFHVKVGARPSVRVSSPRRLLGDRHAMSEVAWTRVRRQQLQRYYAPTGNHDPQARRRPGSALSGVQAPKYPIQA